MKIKILSALAGLAFLMGCSETQQHMGAASDNDNNVLTGGPITGTTIQDLPQGIRDTLQKRVPDSEIANINRINRNGQTFYEISFTQPGKNPKLFLTAEGRVLEESEIPKK
jgi:ABC-type glycerol-3-phosphate transport system substrate-binding protein